MEPSPSDFTETPILTLDLIKRYQEQGFKIVPLDQYSRVPALAHWSPIRDDPTYWQNNSIEDAFRGIKNIATAFGLTHKKDPEGRALYLNCLDVDSPRVLEILKEPIEKEWKTKTFITKTRKGYHVYWFSHKQPDRQINTIDTIDEAHFEIRTRQHLLTLPPSRHRDNAEFHYSRYSDTDEIAIMDDLYDLLVNGILKSFLKDPSGTKRKERKPSKRLIHEGMLSSAAKDRYSDHYFQQFKIKLTDKQVTKIAERMLQIYEEGYRNYLIFVLSGYLYKCGVIEESALAVTEKICTLTNDDQIESMLVTTYNRYTDTVEERNAILGYKGLVEVLLSQNWGCCFPNEKIATQAYNLDLNTEEWHDFVTNLAAERKLSQSEIDQLKERKEKLQELIEQFMDTLKGIVYEHGLPLENIPDVDTVYKLDYDLIKNTPITEDRIDYVINNALKIAPYEQISGRQVFIVLCSSSTHTPTNAGILTKSGAGKGFLLYIFTSLYEARNKIRELNNSTPKALYYKNAIEVIRDEETGKLILVAVEVGKRLEAIETLQEELDETDAELEALDKANADYQTLSKLKQTSRIANKRKEIKDILNREITQKEAKLLIEEEDLRAEINRKYKNKKEDKPLKDEQQQNQQQNQKEESKEDPELKLLEQKQQERLELYKQSDSIAKEIKQLEDEIKELHNKAMHMVDLRHVVLVFPDTPTHEFLQENTALWSHDGWNLDYDAVVSTATGMKTRTTILHGAPVLLFAQSTDNSNKEKATDVNRRYVAISVNTSAPKIDAAIKNKITRIGCARGEYDTILYGDEPVRARSKVIVAILDRKLQALSKPFLELLETEQVKKIDELEHGVLIPYREYLHYGLPKREVLDMTAADTFGIHLTLITRIYNDSRPKIVYSDGEITPIATPKDFRYAMSLLNSNKPGLSPELQTWYEEVVIPVYQERMNLWRQAGKGEWEEEEEEEEYLIGSKNYNKSSSSANASAATTTTIGNSNSKSKGGKATSSSPIIKGKYSDMTESDEQVTPYFTAAMLAKRHKELSKIKDKNKNRGGYTTESVKSIEDKYIEPCVGRGLLDKEEIKNKHTIRYRLVQKQNFYNFHIRDNSQFPYSICMKIENLTQIPNKTSIELQILESLKAVSQIKKRGVNSYKIFSHDEQEISVSELVDRYYHDIADCFILRDDSDRIENERIQAAETKFNDVNSSNNTISNSKNSIENLTSVTNLKNAISEKLIFNKIFVIQSNNTILPKQKLEVEREQLVQKIIVGSNMMHVYNIEKNDKDYSSALESSNGHGKGGVSGSGENSSISHHTTLENEKNIVKKDIPLFSKCESENVVFKNIKDLQQNTKNIQDLQNNNEELKDINKTPLFTCLKGAEKDVNENVNLLLPNEYDHNLETTESLDSIAKQHGLSIEDEPDEDFIAANDETAATATTDNEEESKSGGE